MDFSEFVSFLIRRRLEPKPAARVKSSPVQKPAPGIAKPSRKSSCPCGSSRKFKLCCEPIWPRLRTDLLSPDTSGSDTP